MMGTSISNIQTYKVYMRYKVLFVGSNPSAKSPDSSPFHLDSKSRKTLDKWISNLDVDVSYINVLDVKTPNNRSLSAKEIQNSLESLKYKLSVHDGYKIVALGATAKKALSHIDGVKYLHIHHPSGMTRSYNDPSFKEKTIDTLIKFIEGKI